jgi:hypothetical protein
MAGIYLLKGEADVEYRDFHLGEKPFWDIIGRFGFRPEDREPVMPDDLDPEKPLVVVVSVGEEEARETGFEAGYYRAADVLDDRPFVLPWNWRPPDRTSLAA